MIHISLAAEPIFHIGALTISNALFTALLTSLFIIIIFVGAGRTVKLFPGGTLSQAVEAISESILNLIEQVTHSRHKALQFFPLLMTLFIFILLNNWVGLLPGVGSLFITTPEGRVPILRGANADLNTTLALALLSVITTHIYAIRELGVLRHLKKYVSPNPILLFVGLLELLSELSKVVSFSFRLFGNIFAGEVLLTVVSYLAPLAGPLPFLFLEIFVGFMQALIFTILTLVFLTMATSDHSEDSSHNQEEHPNTPLPTGLLPVETRSADV